MSGQQESPFEILAFEGFSGGLNTQASRPAIKDNEMAWCDGWMPIGDSQLRTIPDIGSSIFTAPGGTTLYFFDFGNIGPDAYCIVVPSDGSIYRVNITTSTITMVAAAGTILTPIPSALGLTQWGNQFIILVANQTNGYFIIDASLFYSPGTIAPDVYALSLTSGGLNYTSAPSYVVFGGTGSGVTLSPVVSNGSVVSLGVTNPGSGYSPGDVVQVQFSGGGSDTGAILVAHLTSGSVSSVTITNGGTNFFGTPTLTFEGGEGSGATATATVAAGVITAVAVGAGGAGYLTAPAVIVAPGFNNAASAILNLMPVSIGGTAVETYQSRVWVADGSQMFFTGPQSYTDFSTASGGGSFESADSFLRVSYIQPRQTNGFLYLIADSSVNYIAGVQTAGSPPVTTFTNQNADPEVGTPYPHTVQVLGSNIVLANAWGAHVSYGGRVTKVSGNLDGVYNTAAGSFGGLEISSAKAILYGKRVWVLLLPIISPYSGASVNELFMWDEKRWWSAQQSIVPIYVASLEVNSVLTAYATDSHNIYPLFQTPSPTLPKVVQSKLWSKPGGYMEAKSSNRAWFIAQYNNANSPNINFSTDNESGTHFTLIPVTTMPGPPPPIYVSPPTATGQVGNLLGITLTTTAEDVILISAAIDAVPVGYRG